MNASHKKLIILGPQCSGKTTLVKHLRKHTMLPIVEEDELFTELNGGLYPEDIKYKEEVLRLRLEDKIRSSDAMVFVSCYCDPAFLSELKASGAKIVQMSLSAKEFERRNSQRMKEEGYADARIWMADLSAFHEKIRKEGLVDKEINAEQTVEALAEEVMRALN